MATTADPASGAAKNPEHDTNDDQNYSDRRKKAADRSVNQQPDEQKDDPENNHGTPIPRLLLVLASCSKGHYYWAWANCSL